MPKRERRERREQRPRIIFAMIRYVHDGVDRDGAVLGYLFNILQQKLLFWALRKEVTIPI